MPAELNVKQLRPGGEGQVLKTVGGKSQWAANVVGAGLRLFIGADQFDNPVGADWIVMALAPAAQDTLTPALSVRRFDDTTEEGVGFTLPIPVGAISMKLEFIFRAQTAPGTAKKVRPKLYYRRIENNKPVSSTWSGPGDGSKLFSDITIPTNTNWHYASETINLADFSPKLEPGNLYQFELTRVDPSTGAGDDLVGDWNLAELRIEFGNEGSERRVFYSEMFDNPVNPDWIVNALATAEEDNLNTALVVRAFDDTAEEGVGFLLPIPTGTAGLRIRLIHRAKTAPVDATKKVRPKLYYRQIPDNGAVSGTWAGAADGSKLFSDIGFPANANYQYSEFTFSLADFSPALVAGRTYQFELTRVDPSTGAGDDVVGDWLLLEASVEML